jgi:hypothetical protein
MVLVTKPHPRKSRMTTKDFIIELFCRIDDAMKNVPKHSQASLWPSEMVTCGILFALKGVGCRAFYRWLVRDFRPLFPGLPERTRLFRLLASHQDWTQHFLAQPSLIGVADSFGVELLHPRREGRSDKQIGKKGKSNWRWIIGAKLGVVLNHLGLVVSWDCDTANVHDGHRFHPMIASLPMLILADTGFHNKAGDPENLKICKRGEWNGRMVVGTLHSMLTSICHFKKVSHRDWLYLGARFAFTVAAFNLLASWHGLVPDEQGFVCLSIAEFSL